MFFKPSKPNTTTRPESLPITKLSLLFYNFIKIFTPGNLNEWIERIIPNTSYDAIVSNLPLNII